MIRGDIFWRRFPQQEGILRDGALAVVMDILLYLGRRRAGDLVRVTVGFEVPDRDRE